MADDHDNAMEGLRAPAPLTPSARGAVLAYPADAATTAGAAAAAAAVAASAVSAAYAADCAAASATAAAEAAAALDCGVGSDDSGSEGPRGVGVDEETAQMRDDGPGDGGDSTEDYGGGSSDDSSTEDLGYVPPGVKGSVRVWNGTDAEGGRAVVRNWEVKAALARWRLRLAQGLTRGGARPAEERRAEERQDKAWSDMRRAWRYAAFARFYDADEGPPLDVQAATPGPAPPLPAGCVRIDAALGEVPPEIFGQAVWVEISPPARIGRSRGGPEARRAAEAARSERVAVRASVRSERERVRNLRERMKTPETRREVHSFHVKRQLLQPPYDPYEATPRAAPKSLGATLEDEAATARRAEQEEARASRWRIREERQREDRGGERSSSACKRARQESVHLLSVPSGLRQTPGAGESARPKRKPPEGASRGAKLARKSE